MELEDRPGNRSLTGQSIRGGAFALACMLVVIAAGCAARHFSYVENGGRPFLLPPGVTQRPAPDRPVLDCPSPADTPFTPRASHHARYGCYAQAGYVDLEPGMRLKVVRPVFAKAGESLLSETVSQQNLNLTVRSNAAGVDTQYWAVKPSAAGAGGAVVIAEANLPPEIARYRLFFLARSLDASRKITLIGASSVAALNAATANLEAYCGKPGSPCLAVSPGMVIGVEIPIIVNRQTVYVPLGASLREALPRQGNVSDVTVERLWNGRRFPIRVAASAPPANSLTSLPLNGGDSILW